MQTICLQINVCHGFDNFNSFENYLVDQVRQSVIQAVKKYLENLDNEIGAQFEREHPEYSYYGKVSRVLKFYYGSIRIKRRRYRCSVQKDVYPLEQFLPDGMLSGKVVDMVIDLSTEIPYARSSRILQELLGLKVSGKGIWNHVQRSGLEERAIHESEQIRIFEEGRDSYPQDWQQRKGSGLPTYLEVDGTMVASREPGEERFEVKSGIMYRNIQQIGKNRYRLMDKAGYSSSNNSYVFSERFYAFCRKRGLPANSSKVFISDGAGWLRTSAEYVFP